MGFATLTAPAHGITLGASHWVDFASLEAADGSLAPLGEGRHNRWADPMCSIRREP
jgi:hypothetical protein